jgi:hypothetical protein
MSTHERKVRKRAHLPLVRVSPTARSLSRDEWEVVGRFGFDRPGDDSPELWDDVEGMTFGMRLVVTAAVTGVVVVVGVLVLIAVMIW